MDSLASGLKRYLPIVSLHVAALLVISGCSSIRTSNEETMLIEGSALTKLSSAVEAYVRYEWDGSEISTPQLLHIATAHDPALLNPFQHRLIKVKTENHHAILLVCTEDGSKGLLEDAGCSTPMDEHLWQENKPCEFTLEAAKACQVNP